MIPRILAESFEKKLNTGKALILMGARQVGKTTLLKTLFNNSTDVLWLNGDSADVRNMFDNISSPRLNAILGNKKVVIIDEAQRIPDIGLKLKLITDEIKNIQLIATGSSSFELANKINEPLTGRKWEFRMFPLSFSEMVSFHGLLEEKRMLPHRLVYGYYPDIVTNPGMEKDLLKQLSDSYLYKDILMWEQIKHPEKLLRLLQALAFQIGNQVSFNELGQITGMDSKTVEKYIALLEQTYIIFRLGSFSRNLRNELKNSKKFYFYDNGIRNALIANFSQIENRQDIGALWENFLVSERIKFLNYSGKWSNIWFWRNLDQREIDFIEDSDGKLTAYEFKWNEGAKYRYPAAFLKAYPNTKIEIVNRTNFEDFLL